MKTESLSHLFLNRYRVVTDRRTDRIRIASTRLALITSRVKMFMLLNSVDDI